MVRVSASQGKKWGRTPTIVLGSVGALVAGIVMIAVFAPGGGDEPADAEDVVATAPADPTAAPAAPETDAAPAPDPTTPPTQEDLSAPDDSTPSQRQALAAARSYLDTDMGFSRAWLIRQLSAQYGSGFSVEDATWAVDHAEADWNAQAVNAAQVLLNEGRGVTRASLIEQLTSEYGPLFTQEQAQHAADAVGL